MRHAAATSADRSGVDARTPDTSAPASSAARRCTAAIIPAPMITTLSGCVLAGPPVADEGGGAGMSGDPYRRELERSGANVGRAEVTYNVIIKSSFGIIRT